MIRAVFFDYDGVLTLDATGSLTTCRHLAAQAGVSIAEVQSALRPHNAALNLGQATHAQVWPEVCRALGRALPVEALQAAFESTPLRREMMALAQRIGDAGLCVGIVTDNKRDRIDHLRRFQDLDAVFDPIVVSAVVGHGKDGPEIFRLALAAARVDAAQAVFIDNTPANLVAAAAVGLHTMHFDDERGDVPALARRLRELGVPC